MQRWVKVTSAALLGVSLVMQAPLVLAESGERKLKTKVTPSVPQIARMMNLTGTVRLEVVIATDGTVKSTRALGGHPLLIQAATNAVQKWKYDPGPESTALIEFHFNPHSY